MSQLSYPTRSIDHGWLPQHCEVHHAFLDKHVISTRPSDGTNEQLKDLHVKAFIQAIKDNNVMKSLSNAMFKQASYTNWKKEEPPQVVDLDHLGRILDSIIETGPRFWKFKNSVGKVVAKPLGTPITGALDLLGNTPAGYDLFRLDSFNVEMKKLLSGWGDMLQTEKSADVFADQTEGWFCEEGLRLLEQGLKGASFDDTYADDGVAKPKRYKTCDSFFTRSFKDVKKLRPVEVLTGKDVPVINNACESTTLRIARNVQLQDQFWLKGQNYSLHDMLSSLAPVYAKDFEGGSVYQAYLSPQDYHRWHSPIKGKVVATAKVDGTYFAVLPDEGSPGDDGLQKGNPHGAIARSQAWLSVSAARYIFIIKPDHEDIAKVALIEIGMGEISSVEPRPDLEDIPSKHRPVDVKAGEELGMFRFGGSTYVVIIKLRDPQRKQLVFKDINEVPITPGQHHWVNSIIARVEDIPKE